MDGVIEIDMNDFPGTPRGLFSNIGGRLFRLISGEAEGKERQRREERKDKAVTH